MGELSSELLQLLKGIFKKCDDVFLEYRDLWRVFSDLRLHIWQDHLPEASNVGQRIEGTIHYLQSKENAQGENALVLFLQILSERYPTSDERYGLLLDIINQFQPVPPSPDEEEQPDVLVEANPMQEPMFAVSELKQIYRCARSIAFIKVTRFRKGKSEYIETGTGWLIAPGLVLTCWHVVAALASTNEPPPTPVELREQIKHMLVSFNHIEIGKGGIQYNVSKLEYPPSETNRQDFALLRLKDRDDQSFTQFACLPIELDAPFAKQTQLLIIQHPQGQTQQFVGGHFVRHSRTTGRILYTTATETGTSGAPVLNRYNWCAVALHNGENREAQLREGTRIKYILSELQSQKTELYNEIMEAQRALDNSLPPVHLTHPLDLRVHPSKVTFHASFSPTISTDQETASSSVNQQTAASSGLGQQYDYVYSSIYNCSSPVSCLAFHPDGHYLASSDPTETIKVWDIAAKSLGYTLKTYTSTTPSLAFSPDGENLASGGNDGTIILWEVPTQKREKTFQGHNEWVSCLAFTSDGRYLVSGSEDGSIKVWEARYGMTASQFKDQTQIFSIALHPYNQLIAYCAFDQDVKLWSISQQKILPFPETPIGVRSLIFSPDGHYLVVGNETGLIVMYETTNWKVVYTFTRHSSRIRCLAFHPDSRLLASGGDDQVIQLWDVSNGKNIQTLVKHTDRIESLAFSPDGQCIASGGKDANIILWKRV